jgi:cytochrome c oxidase subunit 2
MTWLRDSAASFSGDVDWMILLVAIMAGFWFLLAEATLFWLMVRFRRKPGTPALYLSGERRVEKRWITVPHLLILVCDVVLLLYSMQVWASIKQNLPPADETIRVIGQQWAWRFVHPGLDKTLGTADDVETVDKLHLAVNTVYHFRLESLDVLHSFSIPVFRLKQDAVPGRVYTGWFKPISTGTFDIQCAEICGIGHGMMAARVVVESAAAHQEWLTQRTAGR